jgi:hypothetical protein
MIMVINTGYKGLIIYYNMASYVMIHFHCTCVYVTFCVHTEIASHTTFIISHLIISSTAAQQMYMFVLYTHSE